MIIGNGLIANSFLNYFHDDSNVIIFASGVSNSQINDPSEFCREKNMLHSELDKNKLLVYFSTISINDTQAIKSPYIHHKLQMENDVKATDKYIIFRLPQVVGPQKNPNTLANYLYNMISSEKPFKIWGNATRNLIDVIDVASIVSFLIKKNLVFKDTINIATPNFILVHEIVSIFELILNKKAFYESLDLGNKYEVNTDLAEKVAKQLDINFNNHYLEKVLRKYYG